MQKKIKHKKTKFIFFVSIKTKKVTRTIKLKQKLWVNPMFDSNAEARYKADNEFQETILKKYEH